MKGEVFDGVVNAAFWAALSLQNGSIPSEKLIREVGSAMERGENIRVAPKRFPLAGLIAAVDVLSSVTEVAFSGFGDSYDPFYKFSFSFGGIAYTFSLVGDAQLELVCVERNENLKHKSLPYVWWGLLCLMNNTRKVLPVYELTGDEVFYRFLPGGGNVIYLEESEPRVKTLSAGTSFKPYHRPEYFLDNGDGLKVTREELEEVLKYLADLKAVSKNETD